MTQQQIGKRILDISPIIGLFEAQEGEVQHIIGKTGQGKTYEATRRAEIFLKQGYTVYTTWRLNLPDFYDQRESLWWSIKNFLLFRKNYFRFDYKKNWKHVNLDDYLEDGVFNTEKFSKFLFKLTDCIFMLDEGQDVFDSHHRAGQIARQTITRTRHMHKTLIVISQRASAVDVTARNNVVAFYKCECISYPFLPKFFRVYITEDIDESNSNPLWIRHNSVGEDIWKAPIYYSGFARKHIYDLYDSWYMRKNMERSQATHLELYELNFIDRLKLLGQNIIPQKKEKVTVDNSFIVPLQSDNESYIIKIRKAVKRGRPRKAIYNSI